jgi:tRNA(Ile2) C34 agmatinyltransferase TiaS
MIYIGIDDTDMIDTRGTGRLARDLATALAVDFDILAVTRHQLLDDPRVPRTQKNSCAAIHVAADAYNAPILFDRVHQLMMEDFIPGSDPGLCVATRPPQDVINFGKKAKLTFVTQDEARSLAAGHRILLQGIGGTEDGVIGALAAVGLAASGNDGRYILVGNVRTLEGLQSVDTVLAAGVSIVRTINGTEIDHGLVQVDKLRPARRHGLPVAIVQPQDGYWQPLKLD